MADSVGISLGDLADANSLLNDALENAISGLPEGIQDELTPLLQDVENAANGDDRDAALTAMEDYISTLAEDQKDALAPFFDRIDPTSDAQRQINSMTTIDNTNREIRDEMIEMNASNKLLMTQGNDINESIRIDQAETARLLQLFLDQQVAWEMFM